MFRITLEIMVTEEGKANLVAEKLDAMTKDMVSENLGIKRVFRETKANPELTIVPLTPDEIFG